MFYHHELYLDVEQPAQSLVHITHSTGFVTVSLRQCGTRGQVITIWKLLCGDRVT